MAVGTIGVGSGLPLEELLANLRKAESAPLTLIQDKKTLAEARLSAYGVLKSAVESLQKSAEALAKPETFGAMKGASSSETITVAATSSAIAGKYSLEVSQLASAQVLVAPGQADRAAAIGSGGVITFTLGDGTEKTLDLTGKGTSLNDLVAAINADDSLGVQATIVNDGSGSPHRLLLTATETGTEAALRSITVDGNTDLSGVLAFDTSGGPSVMAETAAQNAELTVNGIAVTSQSNTVEDVLEGVTLTLTQTTTAPVTITMSRDDAATTKAINAFVSAYNSLQSTITNLTSYSSTDNTSSVLTGDSAARTIQSRLREVLYTTLPDGEVRTLAQLGISTNPTTGALSVDTEKLNAALKDNLDDVTRLFTGENGMAAKLTAATDSILRDTDGILSSATDRVNRTISDLDTQYENTSVRIDATMERYRQQFIALDSMVAQMSSTSAYLTQQLSMLNNMNSQQRSS